MKKYLFSFFVSSFFLSCGQLNSEAQLSLYEGREGHILGIVELRAQKMGEKMASKCTATILDEKTIVTALHCVSDIQTNNILLQDKISFKNMVQIISPLEKQINIYQKDFDFNIEFLKDENQYFDIAFLKFKHPLFFKTSFSRKATQKDWENLKKGQDKLRVSGYGKTSIIQPQALISGEVLYIGDWGEHSFLTDTLKNTYRAKVCVGDSGGPLYTKEEDGSHLLWGVTSADFAQVYTSESFEDTSSLEDYRCSRISKSISIKLF